MQNSLTRHVEQLENKIDELMNIIDKLTTGVNHTLVKSNMYAINNLLLFTGWDDVTMCNDNYSVQITPCILFMPANLYIKVL